MLKGCMDIMFDILDTAFIYWRAFIVCSFLHESFKVWESSLHVIWNADTAFLLSESEMPCYKLLKDPYVGGEPLDNPLKTWSRH